MVYELATPNFFSGLQVLFEARFSNLFSIAAFQNSIFCVADFIAFSTVGVSLVVISHFSALLTFNTYCVGFV